MKRKQARGFSCHFILCAMGMTLAANAIVAEELPEVTVSATRIREVSKTVVGRSMSTGAPVERITLARSVKFADLDLRTENGALELEKRVDETAKVACSELDKLLPLTPRGGAGCIKEAAESGMVQARRAIAAAKKLAVP
jgi:UrcA family protein